LIPVFVDYCIFNNILQVDKYLKRIIGVDQAHYGQIVRLVWEYIKKNKLQSPKSKKVRHKSTLAVPGKILNIVAVLAIAT
jgi:chromatin remodeling complex protein RSC6